MWISKLFRKIRIGFARMFGNVIPPVTEEKIFGRSGEVDFFEKLTSVLPTVALKRNIVVETDEGKAEIDCLALYGNKLFAVEIKNWKGLVKINGDSVFRSKTDIWTNTVYKKELDRSPLKQLKRAINLLKSSIKIEVWINALVYIDSATALLTSEKEYFDDIEKIAEYMINKGVPCFGNNAVRFFDKCSTSDFLYMRSDRFLECRISDECLLFDTDSGQKTRRDIKKIDIVHHWSYDDINLCLKDGSTATVRSENGKITVSCNGKSFDYALSKLDRIVIGDMHAEKQYYRKLNDIKNNKTKNKEKI